MSEFTTGQETLNRCREVIGNFTALRQQRSRTSLVLKLPGIIQQVAAARDTTHTIRGKLFPKILSGWRLLEDEHARKNKACSHLFNPLAAISIGETTHSRILGNLLNPGGSHGQGRLLLEAFLKRERIKVPFPEKGEWRISIEEGRVDICLWRKEPASVILIENKSNWAVDQQNQLYRYWHENIYKSHPTACLLPENRHAFQVLYLPPDAGKQPEDHSLRCPATLQGLGLPGSLAEAGVTVTTISFRDDIAGWLDDCVELIPEGNARLKTFFQFYKELWTY